MSAEKLREWTLALREFNPMPGNRGCRVAIFHPEIAEIQAAIEADPESKTMVRLVATKADLDFVKAVIDRTAHKIAAERGRKPRTPSTR